MTPNPRTTARALAPAALALALRATALVFTLGVLALPPPTASAAPPLPSGVWPLNPRPEIVRGFEPPPKPWLPGHRGLDLAGSPGQPVLASTAGTITYAGPLAGRGVIVVTSGPFRTTYEPVIPSTHRGTTVTPGEQIGTLSTAGTHCPPHTCLHWGFLQATTYLDPTSLLATRPVRLLPLTPPKPAPNLGQPTDPTRTAPAASADAADAADAASAAREGDADAGRQADAAHELDTVERDTTIDQSASTTQTDPGNAPADRSTGPAPTIVVGVAAALTIGGALLIRRH